MAINVNTVYTTVLSILNKEQRGYITPDEFNKLGTQVQLEIFEKFFEDYNQYIRMPKTDVEFASRMDHIREEFQVFEKSESAYNPGPQTNNIYTQPQDLHRFGSVNYNKGINSPEVEIVSAREYTQQILSPLTQPSSNFPIAKYKEDKITVYPTVTNAYATTDVTFNYIKKPSDVRWGYTIGSLGQYIYDSRAYDATAVALGSLTSSTNFGGFDANSGTYPLVQGALGTNFTTSGSGTGLEISVNIIGSDPVTLTSANTSITVTASGSGYAVDDTITIPSTAITGLTGSIVITLTAANLMGATGQGSIDFELSSAQQTESVLNILMYSGIVIRETQISQMAAGMAKQEEDNSKR